jgi:hypothetical protein
MTNSWKQKIQDEGRNKSALRQQGWAFPAIGMPETPVLRLTRGQAYSGLRRDVYNDECGNVGTRKLDLPGFQNLEGLYIG